MACSREYRGRFAPSPTGPLHFGSVVTALASYLDARANSGAWIVRIEDVDRTREQPGAAERILQALDAFGLRTDEPPLRQSERYDRYAAILEDLRTRGFTFGCKCSRQEMSSCTCDTASLPEDQVRVWRMRVPTAEIRFVDRLYGEQRVTPAPFTLRRSDGLFSYPLAVVVDDVDAGITDIVRGSDLLEATAQQIVLQRALGYAEPRYLHIPVVKDHDGRKLSKQNRTPAVDLTDPSVALRQALTYLRQPEVTGITTDEILREAVSNWSPEYLREITEESRTPHLPVPIL